MRGVSAALIALAALVPAGCGAKSGGEGAPGGMAPVPVVAVRATQAPLAETITVAGSLAADELVDIATEIDGFVHAIAFKEGERVAQGDVLVTLDQQKLAAAVDKAKADLALADATLARLSKLGSSGAVSRQEVDRAVAEQEVARAQLALARAQLEDAVLTAPFDGTVGARLVSPGQYVTRGQRLTTLISQDPIKAELRVPERYLRELAPGQRLALTVAAYPGTTFEGEVYFVAPQIEPASRTALVKARVPNPDGRLRHGMFANLTLIVTVREDAIVVPEAALMWDADKATVFVIDERQQAQIRSVEPGVRRPGLVELVRGIAPGDAVVTEGMQKLRPGAPVKARFEAIPEDLLEAVPDANPQGRLLTDPTQLFQSPGRDG
ncbi:MAG TPA: efflux RND transporter periplasmic adaptor subunit [bacterium]